jgi:pimeloyl-ACP methyl ester carboxylesterase
MNKTIMFVHGAWMTPLCWEKFVGFFEGRGYSCIAPAWPHKEGTVEEIRRNPPAGLAGLGIQEIVARYAHEIAKLDEPPVLIGHSFGGLFVQMLLDRGLGSAGVAIDPAPPTGVSPFYVTSFKANLGVLLTPGGWGRILQPSFERFRYGFVDTLPEAEQHAVYDRYVVPETGRPFFQAAFAPFNKATRVDFKNNNRAPLLLIEGLADKICPPPQVRSNYRKYKNSSAVTDYKEFDGRVHWIIGEDGWEEVAGYIAGWLERLPAGGSGGAD